MGLEEKKKVLSEVCKTYNEELVTFTKAAGEQTDMSQMKPSCKIKWSKVRNMWGTWTQNKETWWGFGYAA